MNVLLARRLVRPEVYRRGFASTSVVLESPPLAAPAEDRPSNDSGSSSSSNSRKPFKGPKPRKPFKGSKPTRSERSVKQRGFGLAQRKPPTSPRERESGPKGGQYKPNYKPQDKPFRPWKEEVSAYGYRERNPRRSWEERGSMGVKQKGYEPKPMPPGVSESLTAEQRERMMLDEAATAEGGSGGDLRSGAAEEPLSKVRDVFTTLEKAVLAAEEVNIVPVKPPRDAKVARLNNRLQRVLFSPGVHHMRDPRTGVFNFDQALERIPTPEEFAFHRLPQYITASQDQELSGLAATHNVRYTGSTSTLTQSLSQIYFTLSDARPVDTSTLSAEFSDQRTEFTAGAQLPALINVRLQDNGTYAIDNDKTHSIDNNVLSDYGRILEKMLTVSEDDFKRFHVDAPESAVPESERTEREAYSYCKSGRLLMRSQLDCEDSRLPGSGTFDIKTRAVYPIRQDRANWVNNAAYTIHKQHGYLESFEREYYDLSRSGMLKYCFQARIGQMDGIFVAYHNTKTFFGFQYLPLSEIDRTLFGSTEMADQVFQLCVGLLERLLDEATKLFPGQTFSMSLRRQTMQRPDNSKELMAVVQPSDGGAKRALSLRIQNVLDGKAVWQPYLKFSDNPDIRKQQKWSVEYKIAVSPEHFDGEEAVAAEWNTVVSLLRSMNHLYAPDGKTPDDMYAEEQAKLAGSGTESGESPQHSSGFFPPTEEELKQPPRTEWRRATRRIAALRAAAQESGRQAMARQIVWPQSRIGDSWSPEPKRLSVEEQAAWDRKVAAELEEFMAKCSIEEKEKALQRKAEQDAFLARKARQKASKAKENAEDKIEGKVQDEVEDKVEGKDQDDAVPDVPVISSAWPRI